VKADTCFVIILFFCSPCFEKLGKIQKKKRRRRRKKKKKSNNRHSHSQELSRFPDIS